MHGRKLLLVASLVLPAIAAPVSNMQPSTHSGAVIEPRDASLLTNVFHTISTRMPSISVYSRNAETIRDIDDKVVFGKRDLVNGGGHKRGLVRGGGHKRDEDVAIEAVEERGLVKGGGHKRGLVKGGGQKREDADDADVLDERGLVKGGGHKRDQIDDEVLNERGLVKGGGHKRGLVKGGGHKREELEAVEAVDTRGLVKGGGH